MAAAAAHSLVSEREVEEEGARSAELALCVAAGREEEADDKEEEEEDASERDPLSRKWLPIELAAAAAATTHVRR